MTGTEESMHENEANTREGTGKMLMKSFFSRKIGFCNFSFTSTFHLLHLSRLRISHNLRVREENRNLKEISKNGHS